MHSHYSIRVQSPCTENWAAMTATERGRYCQACQRTVHDLTGFTDRQIFDLYQQSGGKLCGRLQRNRQAPAQPKKSWQFAWIPAGLLTLTLPAVAIGQNTKHKHKSLWSGAAFSTKSYSESKTDNSALKQFHFYGTVVDSAYPEPIIGATVQVVNENGKTLAGVYTDADGRYKLDFEVDSARAASLKLTFSYVDVVTQTFPLLGTPQSLDVKMAFANMPIEEPIIVGAICARRPSVFMRAGMWVGGKAHRFANFLAGKK
jgi:hypothetical protein